VNEDAIIKGVKLVAESLAVRQPLNSSTYFLFCRLFSWKENVFQVHKSLKFVFLLCFLITDLNNILSPAETYLWSPRKRH